MSDAATFLVKRALSPPETLTFNPTTPGELAFSAGLGVGVPYALSRSARLLGKVPANPMSLGRAAYVGLGPVGIPLAGATDLAQLAMRPSLDPEYQAGRSSYVQSLARGAGESIDEMRRAGLDAEQRYGRLLSLPVKALHGITNPVTSLMYLGRSAADLVS